MGRTTAEMTGEEEEEGQTVVGGRIGRPGDARLMGEWWRWKRSESGESSE